MKHAHIILHISPCVSLMKLFLICLRFHYHYCTNAY